MKQINYNNDNLKLYLANLKVVGSLSSLFSDSNIPMIYYRATENLYCEAFGAENLSRSDVTADAKFGKYGIGIKTFLENNKKTYQKVAEFNNQQNLYRELEPLEMVKKVSELRNKRIKFTVDAFDIEEMIYHCIVRNEDGFFLHEEKMDYVDIDKIKLVKVTSNIIDFVDGIHNYKFNITKSTLFKQFFTDDYFDSIKVEVLVNPLTYINMPGAEEFSTEEFEQIILPLYATKAGNNYVPDKSGINQWNANGRRRDPNEVYIPYPAKVRNQFENFFPDRDVPFDVQLPSGQTLNMKVCQDSGKAIMSNPNKALGEWILREVLNLNEEELCTYEMLQEIGIDSVVFTKTTGGYKVDFKEVGSYEEFIDNIIE